MIRFYFHPTPNPAKVALFLEEAGLPYEAIPVDTRKGEQHSPAFRAINPNAEHPAIVDTDGPDGEVSGCSIPMPSCSISATRPAASRARRRSGGSMLSWLMFIASGIGPYSGQAVHFQRAAPEKLPYAINRYRREVERHYCVLERAARSA